MAEQFGLLCKKFHINSLQSFNYGGFANNFYDGQVDSIEFVCLMLAIGQDNLESVQMIIKEYPNLINFQNKKNQTPFYYAIESNKFDIGWFLYKSGSNLNQGRKKLVKYCWDNFESKKEIEYKDICQYACAQGNLKLVKWLLESKLVNYIDIFGRDEEHISAYAFAQINSHKYLVNWLDKLVTYECVECGTNDVGRHKHRKIVYYLDLLEMCKIKIQWTVKKIYFVNFLLPK